MGSLRMRDILVSRADEVGPVIADLGDGGCRVDPQAGRQETPIIQMFEMRPMTKTASAAALVYGPSHESCLPGRPPNHWLWPSRESVVNALLPWRVRVSADSVQPRIRTRRPDPIGDRSGPFRAQAKVVRDGPPDGLRSHPKIYPIQTRTPPTPPGRRPGRGESTAVRGSGRGRRTPVSRPPRTAIPTGPPVADRPESFRPIHGTRDQESPPSPMRLRSHRVSRPHGDRREASPADRAAAAVSHSALCPILRRPRVKAPCPRVGRERVSISDPSIGPFHGRYSWETRKSSG
jgi:hypothetical protein